jgi:peptidoglycan/LPS O-acetylase OafA/YrhL
MVNGVSWSLTNELFFYLLFTIAIINPYKKYTLLLLLVYFIFLTLLPVWTSTADAGTGITQLLLFPMNIEFLLGIAVVYFLDKITVKLCLPLLVAGITWFAFSAIFYNGLTQFIGGGYSRVIMFGLPSFLIILSLVKYELVTPVEVNNLFLKLGDASYSIYLFHLPIVAAFFKVLIKFPATGQLATILSCILLAIVSYSGIIIFEKIESPLIKWLNKKLVYKSYK